MLHMSQNSYNIKIVEALLKNEAHVRGLANVLHTNQTTIARKAKELYKNNIIDCRQEGKNKVLFLRKTLEAKQYSYIAEIYKLLEAVKKYPNLRRIIDKIKENNKIDLAILFGSYAKGIANKDSDDFSDTILKTKKQFENSIAIFKELILRRKKKILELAFVAAETGISKRDFENMLAVEKECFEEIMKSLEKGDKKIAEILKGVSEIKEEKINKMIVFVQDTDEFLDLEGNKLGPFKKGDVSNLSEEIANILLIDKKADIIDED